MKSFLLLLLLTSSLIAEDPYLVKVVDHAVSNSKPDRKNSHWTTATYLAFDNGLECFYTKDFIHECQTEDEIEYQRNNLPNSTGHIHVDCSKYTFIYHPDFDEDEEEPFYFLQFQQEKQEAALRSLPVITGVRKEKKGYTITLSDGKIITANNKDREWIDPWVEGWPVLILGDEKNPVLIKVDNPNNLLTPFDTLNYLFKEYSIQDASQATGMVK